MLIMNKTQAFKGKKEKAHMVCKKHLQNKHDFLKFYAEMPIILTGSVKKYDSLGFEKLSRAG